MLGNLEANLSRCRAASARWVASRCWYQRFTLLFAVGGDLGAPAEQDTVEDLLDYECAGDGPDCLPRLLRWLEMLKTPDGSG